MDDSSEDEISENSDVDMEDSEETVIYFCSLSCTLCREYELRLVFSRQSLVTDRTLYLVAAKTFPALRRDCPSIHQPFCLVNHEPSLLKKRPHQQLFF